MARHQIALLLAFLLAWGGATHAQTPAPAPQSPAPQGATPPVTPEPPPPSWVPKQAATLVFLDKIAAKPTTMTVPVGQTATFESLTVTVRACFARPPDQAANATAFLDITDSHPGAPDFHGWIFSATPEVSMLQHPVYDVRLAGCG